MSLLRCESCLGKKTVMGLGMLEHECPNCKGIGYVKGEEAVKKQSDENDKPKHKGKKNK